jgi:hypothetical protein
MCFLNKLRFFAVFVGMTVTDSNNRLAWFRLRIARKLPAHELQLFLKKKHLPALMPCNAGK